MQIEGIGDHIAERVPARCIAHVESIPGEPARFAGLHVLLPDLLEGWLAREGIQLYTHQAETIEAVRAKRDVVITTPTASGKTLAFTLPVLEILADEPEATALYLYPSKALANDQLQVLQSLGAAAGLDPRPAIYDGDTPAARRPGIRATARILLSNPYELHQILPWHAKWHRFLSGLRVVVVDEAHRYRSVFGAHIALLLRRLLRVCRHHGGDPVFVLSTATLANPREFARLLTGRPAVLVEESGAPQSPREFVFYNPVAGGGQSTLTEAKRLFVDCVGQGLQTLCFTSSRKAAEMIGAWAREEVADPSLVATYRAGYLAGERREIEQGLREGRLRGVVSTNALELGIDVGGLDAVVIAGYPGSISATWQRAGRAGRTGRPSLAVLVANEGPLDQYYMRHPDAFFGRPHERACLDPENPEVLAGHLLCAAAELPLTLSDRVLFGKRFDALLEPLARHHLLRGTPYGHVYCGPGRAVSAVDLAGGTDDRFTVVTDGRLLETLDRTHAYREAHPGAILLHQHGTYRITSIDLETRECTAEPAEVDYLTAPLFSTAIIPGTVDLEARLGSLIVRTGEVTVLQDYPAFCTRRYGETIGVHPLDLPPLSFETVGCWWTFPAGVLEALRLSGHDPAGALHGAEHAVIACLPLHLLCEPGDTGGFSTISLSMAGDPGDGCPAICIYDAAAGGTGIAREASEHLITILSTARTLVADCPCEDGCPSCIYSPRCGNDNQPLDKDGSVAVLDAVLGIASTP
ncbi:MAG: DEAD/DEAH box helicase [Methanospirillum sp.]|nr:DEAD/DEAH box helicase [Methanospirillum sp.]